MKNRVLSISQLSAYIKGVFEDELFLHNITVYGEVYEYTVAANNTFITLKEGDFTIHCVKFGLLEKLELGVSIAVTGSVNYYAKANRLTVQIKSFEYYGEGKIIKDLSRLKEQLKTEGVFDKSVKLPQFVKKVSIVTSISGAVIHDFLSVLQPSCPYVDVDVCGVKVQGEGSSAEIASMLDALKRSKVKPDLIVLARGGGSNSDLETFNDERLARRTAECGFALISAIGHETNYTLTDFCASYRAGTPSIAAEKIVQINRDFINNLQIRMQDIASLLDDKYSYHEKKLMRIAYAIQNKSLQRTFAYEKLLSKYKQRIHTQVNDKLRNEFQRARHFGETLTVQMTQRQLFAQQRFQADCARLQDINPLKILSLGYGKVLKGKRVIKSVDEVVKGDLLTIYATDGTIDASVVKAVKREAQK